MSYIHEQSPASQRIGRIARDWLIAIAFGFAFCISTADDIDDAQVIAAAKHDAQVQAKHEATVNAKARAITEQMIAEGAAK